MVSEIIQGRKNIIKQNTEAVVLCGMRIRNTDSRKLVMFKFRFRKLYIYKGNHER